VYSEKQTKNCDAEDVNSKLRRRGRPPRWWIDDVIDWCSWPLPVTAKVAWMTSHWKRSTGLNRSHWSWAVRNITVESASKWTNFWAYSAAMWSFESSCQNSCSSSRSRSKCKKSDTKATEPIHIFHNLNRNQNRIFQLTSELC